MKRFLLFLFANLIVITNTNASFPIVNGDITINETCDIIILRNGDEISSKIIEITPDLIKYKKCENSDGPLISIYKDDILMIRYADGTKDLFNTSTKNIPITEGNFEGFGIASVIFALIAWVMLGLPLSIAAVILGLVGLKKDNKYLAIAVLGIIFGLINIIILVSAL